MRKSSVVFNYFGKVSATREWKKPFPPVTLFHNSLLAITLAFLIVAKQLKLIPWSKDLDEILAFYGTWRFVIVFTWALQWTLSWTRYIQRTSSYIVSLRLIFIVILPSTPMLPTWSVFPSRFVVFFQWHLFAIRLRKNDEARFVIRRRLWNLKNWKFHGDWMHAVFSDDQLWECGIKSHGSDTVSASTDRPRTLQIKLFFPSDTS